MCKSNNILKLVLCIALIMGCNNAIAELNSATITEDTSLAIPSCFHFKILGVCSWYSPGTGVMTTPYVEEYLPDLVVSVFNKAGDNPWFEINNTVDAASTPIQQTEVSTLTGFSAGSGNHSFANVDEQNVFFKEVDVIGNPGLVILDHSAPGIVLPSTAIPLKPYYSSMMDAPSWRGLPQMKMTLAEEAYAAVADITNHIGSLLIDWGGLYPHEGKVETSNDAKAAAVIAQRATDLTTATNTFGHIVYPLSTKCGVACTASPIQENSSQTQFQMIYPAASYTCDYFGKTMLYGQSFESEAQGNYVWIVWRYYQGCENGTGTFMGKTLLN